ncbi:uncharacterized protein EHS24_002341 [Apiotrichum porosum]|uniref:Uncharacterized protein n=1 Tax=Apiotrichum porosum TaxID=105984 RepID=A0A427XIG1_9TREE|nr:uncharacterized protein EHS24_002341 [Apiotrichum porosum]RSH78612.1 hypothetical protein EHS24_002341 [Apiotrichum porosum]
MASLISGLLAWLRSLLWSKHLEVTIVGLQASGKTSLVNVLGNGQWSEEVVPTVSFNLRQIRKGNVTMKVWDVAERDSLRMEHMGFWLARGRTSQTHSDLADPQRFNSPPGDHDYTRHVLEAGRPRTSFSPKTLRRPPADGTMASHRAGAFPAPASKKPAQSTSQPNPGYQNADRHAGAAQVQINVGKVLRFVVDAADPKSLPTATSELHSLLALPALAGVPLLVLANKNDLPGALVVDDLIRDMRLSEIGGRAVSCYSTSNKTKHNLDIVLEWLTQRAH